MTTPNDKFKPWGSRLPALPESEEERPLPFKCGNPELDDWMQSEPHLLEPLPPIDWLALLGVGSTVVAFLLWAMPYCGSILGTYFCERPLTLERLPAAASFLALAVILLLLRRR